MENLVKISIADDCGVARFGCKALIGSFPGCTLHTVAHNGRQLLEQLSSNEPLPDILLLDTCMPAKNGYDVMREMNNKGLPIKVIVLSYFCSRYLVSFMFKYGVRGILSRNNVERDLHHAIESVLVDGYYFTPQAPQMLLQSIQKSPAQVQELSARQKEFFHLYCAGMGLQQIAEKINVKLDAVKDYHKKIGEKFGIQARNEYIQFALNNECFELEALRMAA
jgi:DNA-binding NarL/FixJ family response regulator